MNLYLKLPGQYGRPSAVPSVGRATVAGERLGLSVQWLRETLQVLRAALGVRALVTLGLVVVLVISALATIYAVHLNRVRFVELEALQAERDALDSQWSRLILEESALSAHHLIEQAAAERYGLQIVDPAQVEVVE